MDALVAAEQAGTKREADEDVVALEHEAVLSAMLPAAEEEARPIRPRQIGVDDVAPKASAESSDADDDAGIVKKTRKTEAHWISHFLKRVPFDMNQRPVV